MKTLVISGGAYPNFLLQDVVGIPKASQVLFRTETGSELLRLLKYDPQKIYVVY